MRCSSRVMSGTSAEWSAFPANTILKLWEVISMKMQNRLNVVSNDYFFSPGDAPRIWDKITNYHFCYCIFQLKTCQNYMPTLCPIPFLFTHLLIVDMSKLTVITYNPVLSSSIRYFLVCPRSVSQGI